jgi:hypothetical protein
MLSKYNVDRAFRNAVRKAKVMDFHFHDLRHNSKFRIIPSGIANYPSKSCHSRGMLLGDT